MSVPDAQFWLAVLSQWVDMVECYVELYHQYGGCDKSRTFFLKDIDMVGGHGSLRMGPMCLGLAYGKYWSALSLNLKQHSPVPCKVEWNTLVKSWQKSQGAFMWKDPLRAASHRHYNYKTDPIVVLTATFPHFVDKDQWSPATVPPCTLMTNWHVYREPVTCKLWFWHEPSGECFFKAHAEASGW